jgi:methylenetetrahydrofolate reductase (NADPH)
MLFTVQGFDFLLSRIARLNKFDPLAVSITWGAGGSTKDRSLELAGICQLDYGIDTVLHLTCTNMEKGMVDDALKVCFLSGCAQLFNLIKVTESGGQRTWYTDHLGASRR